MANITYRATKGTPLTNTEVDNNFQILSDRVSKVLTKSITTSYTLTVNELDSETIIFTGTLSNHANITIPTGLPKHWNIYNNTTGGYNLYVTSSVGGTILPIRPSSWNLVVSNGTTLLYNGTNLSSDSSKIEMDYGEYRFNTNGNERLRIGSNGEIGTNGANYGNFGQVLTSRGNGITPVWTNSGDMFKNKIINGNFDIWQRGTSQTSSGYGSDDRWLNGNVGSTKTHSRQAFTVGQTDVPGNPKYFSRTVVSSVAGAGNYCSKIQKIEDVTKSSGKTFTFSFYAKADAAKNLAVEFTQYFGTGGSPYNVGIGVTTFNLTASWQKFTTTVTFQSISDKTLGADNNSFGIVFWFDAGSDYNSRTNNLGKQSGTFDIAQVQFEEGSVATSFEERPYGIELQLCQRYYRIIASAGTAYNAGYAYGGFYINFSPAMRTSPTVEGSFSVNSGAAGTIGANTSTETIFIYNSSSNWTAGTGVNFIGYLSAEL